MAISHGRTATSKQSCKTAERDGSALAPSDVPKASAMLEQGTSTIKGLEPSTHPYVR